MFKILKSLRGKGMFHTRGYQTRPKICQEPGVFVHPELRRTIPLVYFNKSELPFKLDLELHFKPQCGISTVERQRRCKEYFRQFCTRQRSCFSDTYYWSEFRRKIIYGSY
ncbi:uncharacterized protein LOC128256795 [Drosophila gunungcola]|uniref:uncharacterized protein LOC128256795 n=1 Tax=Drosophila gunungcola TaxID=103775 RepID=UPI0022E908B0|nr:uncharacterized protein LOC128256795 [Drosophila gunungcola]